MDVVKVVLPHPTHYFQLVRSPYTANYYKCISCSAVERNNDWRQFWAPCPANNSSEWVHLAPTDRDGVKEFRHRLAKTVKK